jgi:hypothetical protein
VLEKLTMPSYEWFFIAKRRSINKKKGWSHARQSLWSNPLHGQEIKA